MKKLLILVIALALVGGVAMAQVTVGGIVEFGIQNDFDDATTASNDFGDTRLIVSGSVDEYTSVYFRLPVGPAAITVDRVHATTNLGALLGTDDAGVSLSMNYGWNQFRIADVASITGYGFEGLRYNTAGATTRLRDIIQEGVALKAGVMDMVNVYAAFGLADGDLDPDSDQQNIVLGLDTAVEVGVGTVVAELAFSQTNEGAGLEDWKVFGVGAGLKGIEAVDDLTLGLTAGFVFFLDAEDPAPEWKYGVGLTADYAGLVNSGISFLGWDDVEAAALGINVGVKPLDFVSLDAGFILILDDAAMGGEDGLNSMDISVGLMAGAMEFRLGYFLVDDDQTALADADLNAVTTAHSGLYMNWKVSF